VALALAAALAAAAGGLAPDDLPPDNPRPLAGFPPEIGGWSSGLPQTLAPDLLAALRLQDYLLADFRRVGDPAPPVNFYVAYYSRQRIGGMTHSPSSCIPGAGWRILADAVCAAPLADGADQPVRRILVGKGEARQLVYYWFDQRCRSLTSQTALKWWLLVDSIRLRRSDGALVRLATALTPGEAEAAGDRRLATFLAQVRPALTTRLGRCEPAR
jgi:EpsI family protein